MKEKEKIKLCNCDNLHLYRIIEKKKMYIQKYCPTSIVNDLIFKLKSLTKCLKSRKERSKV